MLNFDVDRFLRTQSGAVALAEHIDTIIGDCLRSGAKNIFFLGTGGAAILMQPAALLLGRRSAFGVFLDVSAELILAGHAHLGPHSIVVIPSLSGTTKESIAAMAYCRHRGATVVSLIGHAGTPLADADHALVNFAEDDTSSESFYLQSLLITLSIMGHLGECPEYPRLVDELRALPTLLVKVKAAFEARAGLLAEALQMEPYHIITAAGLAWPQAFYYGMCILEEMQWIRTRPVHASDFFHGTLELVEPGVSVILLKGEDAARPLAERVETFAKNYTNKLNVLDTAMFETPGVSAETRAMVSPVLLATLLERLSAHLEVKRNHPLTTRRYYKRVEY